MGCDIHSFVSVRNGDGPLRKIHLYRVDKYRHTLVEIEPCNYRSYMLFGILAGVRYTPEHGPIVEPRGIGVDASYEVKEKWEEDKEWCHTPSWYTLQELRIASRDKKRYNKEERQALKYFISCIDFMVDADFSFADDVDVRIDFWFDN